MAGAWSITPRSICGPGTRGPIRPFRCSTDVWSDGANWETGHWLNGRLGALTADALVAQILADYGMADGAVGDLDGTVDGYLVGQVMSARDALEPLSQLLAVRGRRIRRRVPLRAARPAARTRPSTRDDLVEEGERPLISIRRAQETELPAEIAIGFSDALADYRAGSVNSRRLVGGSRRVEASETGAVLSTAVAGGLADALLQDLWAGRETIGARAAAERRWRSSRPTSATLDLGDGDARTLLVTRIEDAGLRRIEARTIEPDILSPVPAAPRALAPRSRRAATPRRRCCCSTCR